MNLIDMLLGIENTSTRNVPSEVDGSGDGGSSPHASHQNKAMPGTAAQQPQPQQQFPSNSGSIRQDIPQQISKPMMGQEINQRVQKPMNQFIPISTPPQSQQQGMFAQTASIQQQPQQLSSNNGFIISNQSPVMNQMILDNQQVGKSFTVPTSKNNTSSPQDPPPLSINNSEDLTLVLSAVKETQTNLRMLQPLVMQLADPSAMEDLATAFKITATSSQCVLASDLPDAYSKLNYAWAKIKKIEGRLAQASLSQQQSQQQQSMNMGAYSA
eukprot:CAMPEP_0196158164 /NCGR_PEP_ID=MMETSP0910-20130528/45326_1 /TAXON_ID=49265 /ORGANISM="Thalassiosira rotula, Strain GSO102" /LENGTH=269 /DNA_ID=CAMNT_0041422997 /DNA_START=1 /DNA_END=807 /DNA_ORIENTATION=+